MGGHTKTRNEKSREFSNCLRAERSGPISDREERRVELTNVALLCPSSSTQEKRQKKKMKNDFSSLTLVGRSLIVTATKRTYNLV